MISHNSQGNLPRVYMGDTLNFNFAEVESRIALMESYPGVCNGQL